MICHITTEQHCITFMKVMIVIVDEYQLHKSVFLSELFISALMLV